MEAKAFTPLCQPGLCENPATHVVRTMIGGSKVKTEYLCDGCAEMHVWLGFEGVPEPIEKNTLLLDEMNEIFKS